MFKKYGPFIARHLATVIMVVSIVSGGFVWVVKPRAEDFVRSTVAREKFATARELRQQTEALQELMTQFDEQSVALDEQSRQQTALKTDIEAIKSLQRETLRVLLRVERDN